MARGRGLFCGCLSPSAESRRKAQLAERSLAERVAEEEVALLWMMEEEKLIARSAFSAMIASGVFPVLGLLSSCLLLWTALHYPFLSVRLEGAEWGRQWLLTAALDYYVCLSCLFGVILASEPLEYGIPWCLAVALLGAPLACVYLVVRACAHGTLGLVMLRTEEGGKSPRNFGLGAHSNTTIGFASGFYAVAGLSLALWLLWTAQRYPPYPFQETNPEWLFEWLLTAIGGVCTAAACLCGLIVSTEESFFESVVWCLVVLLLGGPGACAYLSYRAVCFRSILLQEAMLFCPPTTLQQALPIDPLFAPSLPSFVDPSSGEWSRPLQPPSPSRERSRPYSRPAAVDQMADVQV